MTDSDPIRTSRPSANTGTESNMSDHTLWSPTKLMYVRRPFGPNAEPQAFKSVIRMIATTRPSLAECSFVSLLQVQTKSFLAGKGLAVLHDPKFSLGDLTDHSVHHHLIFGSLRTRLNDDVTQRDSLEAGGLWMVPRHRHGSRHPAPLSCPYSSWFAQRQASP